MKPLLFRGILGQKRAVTALRGDSRKMVAGVVVRPHIAEKRQKLVAEDRCQNEKREEKTKRNRGTKKVEERKQTIAHCPP